jgi:hypothetical protein
MPSQSFRWTNPPKNFHFSGQEALRAYFFPRQTIQIQEAARIIGVGRERMYRVDLGIPFRRRPGGRQFILLDDLISFLFPSETSNNSETSDTSLDNCTNGVAEEKKRGRPRGSKNKPKAPLFEGGVQ